MTDVTVSDIAKLTMGRLESNESTLIKTVRMTTNLFINILMCLTVFVSLLYAFSAEEITAFRLHIILCVLGYHLLMYQGTLLLSKFNSWSLYLNRRNRKRLHILFQLLGCFLVVVGSSIIMYKEQQHFNSLHGTLGITTLFATAISIANGALATYAYKINRSYTYLIKFLHYISGIITLFMSAATLSTGFDEFPFRMWISHDNSVTALICMTWLSTFLVSSEFLLLSGQRIRNFM